MVITNPATLYVVLLTAASHYAASNQFLHKPTVQRVLLDLKQATLTSINNCINNTPHGEPVADPVIAAVAKMASYEAMFGTPSLCHTHMRGLQTLVAARGGLQRLTGLGGFMMRMVTWLDINSAFLIGGQAYFYPEQPLAGQTGFVTQGLVMEPNPVGFLSGNYQGEVEEVKMKMKGDREQLGSPGSRSGSGSGSSDGGSGGTPPVKEEVTGAISDSQVVGFV